MLLRKLANRLGITKQDALELLVQVLEAQADRNDGDYEEDEDDNEETETVSSGSTPRTYADVRATAEARIQATSTISKELLQELKGLASGISPSEALKQEAELLYKEYKASGYTGSFTAYANKKNAEELRKLSPEAKQYLESSTGKKLEDILISGLPVFDVDSNGVPTAQLN